MAAATETQRLISVSLGKIAQSRGQRGGINLHKNLLVATVLHKARTAYMMENYNYQIALQKQKSIEQQPTTESVDSSNVVLSSSDNRVEGSRTDMCVTPCKGDNQIQSESRLDVDSSVVSEQDNENVSQDSFEVPDKENHPPVGVNLTVSESSHESCKQTSLLGEEHLAAANQLSQEVQLAASENQASSCGKQSGASTTCLSVLKRRRENRHTTSQDNDSCSVSKIAKLNLSLDVSSALSSQLSHDSEDFNSDTEQDMQTDSPQITNLVSIFNSGFSGLCASSSSPSPQDRPLSTDTDLCKNNSTTLSHQWPKRVESQSQSCYSRKMSDSSLLCSSQVERLDSLPSAIVLSA